MTTTPAAARTTHQLGASLFLILLVVGDVAISLVAVALAYFARFEGVVAPEFRAFMVPTMLTVAIVVPITFALTGLYNYVWRQVGVDMVLRVAGVVFGLAAAALALDLALSVATGQRPVPIGVLAIAFTFVFLGAVTTRTLSRLSRYMRARGGSPDGKPVLVVGAGDAGSLLMRDIEVQPGLGLNVVGVLDDDRAKHGRMLRNTRVLGGIDDIERLVADHSIQEILVAVPSATHSEQARILDVCAASGIPVRVMPGLAKGASMVGVRDLRSVEILDLLGREPVPIDAEQVMASIADKTVLVTGAAGSIGSELCRQLLVADPSRIVLIDVDESRLYELYLELQDVAPGIPQMRICDVRDGRKLNEVFVEFRPDMVLHAAAYKHVPLMEIEPDEAVKTNVVGTRNVVEACERAAVDRLVLISTDKAVAPKSVMGMTKAIAERIVISACKRGLHASAVRFGNVLGSRGSVVPLFEEQLRRGGALKVTHPDVTRYFMTIPEAARLVLQAQALSAGGDIFVLEMGEPVRIVDLAEKMISLSGTGAHIEFTGLRPAEKLHEVLTNSGEDLLPTEAQKVNRLNSIPLPLAELDGVIHRLATAARLNDRVLLRATIRELLPETVELGTSAFDYLDESESAAHIDVLDPDMDTQL